MKVNLGVELDDTQRRALASIIKGKPTMKMASRDDVRGFLEGIVAGVRELSEGEAQVFAATDSPAAVEAGVAAVAGARAPYSAAEQAEAEKLIAEGKHPDYVRGWIATGRAIRSQRNRS